VIRSCQRPRVTSLVVLALLLAGWDATPLSTQRTPPRVVAIADIHGDLDAFTSILQRTRLIDAARRWIGGDTVLVQLGDFTDRGPKVREVMELLMSLEDQARRTNGRVVVLLGNHEIMNIMGDLRYVTPEIVAAFADAKSENRRQSAYDAYTRLLTVSRDPAGTAGEVLQPVSRDAWMAEHPPGFIEYTEAFGPRGRYGAWLRRKPVVFSTADVAFLHGGLDPARAAATLDEVNDTATAEIRRFDNVRARMADSKLILPFYTFQEILSAAKREIDAFSEAITKDPQTTPPDWLRDIVQLDSWSVIAPNGPVWFRGYATWSDTEGERGMTAVTERYKIARVAVGHTITTTKRITARFGDRAFLLDTGMSSTYVPDGAASALEIRGGRFTAIYPTGETVLVDTKAATAIAR
jgi:hypothetical protein